MTTSRLISIKTALLTAAGSLIASASLSAGAANGNFNPDKLDTAHLDQVSQVCENVMGLHANEPLTGGYWLGDARLEYWTSHYRGCVTSLSDSIQKVADVEATEQADASCQAKGYQTGSSDLALCVLQAADERRGNAETATATPISYHPETANGSFFYASGKELNRREQIACASLGLDPSNASFAECVKDLKDTLYAIDNPITPRR